MSLRPRVRPVPLFLALLLASGCATYRTTPIEEVGFETRARTQVEEDIRVTAAVLSKQEARDVFGVDLYGKSVQPIWLEIENRRKRAVWRLESSTDPMYYTPLEAAYMSHKTWASKANREMDEHFFENAMGNLVEPGESIAGFIFTNLDEGTKAFNVDLVSEDHELATFTFFIQVPGLKIDYHAVDFESLYAEGEVADIRDPEKLRVAISEIPCCTLGGDKATPGDPINFAVIATGDDVHSALLRAGWDETETIYKSSLWKTAMSAIFGGAYRYSPVSALYVFGRGQDAALQKARSSIHLRNHLRLWLAPIRYKGLPVWAGQISRDIGVRFARKTITTHKIDPDIDEAREYLLENLWYSQSLEKYAYTTGVGRRTADDPGRNFTGDPYFTDGMRLVMWLTEDPMGLDEVTWVKWEDPDER